MRRSVDADGVELALSKVIDRHVVGDLEQPARELELGPVLVDVIEDLDERVLRQILGDLAVPYHTENEREDRTLVPAEKLAECRFPPLLGEGDDVGIGEVREVE